MKNKPCFIIGVLLIGYTGLINMISSSKIAFSLPIILLGAGFIIYSLKGKQIKSFIDNNTIIKRIYNVSKIGVSAVIIMLLMIEVIILAFPKHNTDNSDYILVLGSGLSNGYEPSLTLANRLDAAITYINYYNNNEKIIVSGGQGNDEKIAESEAMKKYLIEHGVDENRILVENKSSTTYENFKFSKEIIEKDSNKNLDSLNIKIITTNFHAFRSRILAWKNGYTNVTNYSSPTVWYLAPVNYVRESFAVVKSVLFD